MRRQSERFREITKFGVIPSPSGPGALVLHQEEAADCLLVLRAFRPADRANPLALVTFGMCEQSIFGYPNDEAYAADPRGLSYGFYEVINSTWSARLAEYNRRAFPDTVNSDRLRHFFVGCHDCSGEFLAEDIAVEVFDSDYESVLRLALSRLRG